MRFATIAAVMLALIPASAVGPVPAEAKGCLKGAVVGGVAGHYAGHHGIMGAIGGCVVGHHMANEKAKEMPPQGAQNAAPPAPTPN
jgi:outer membrane lipoprotein SlyB